MHGVEHGLPRREEERDLVVVGEDKAPEDEPDHHGGGDGDDDGEARALAAARAELVCLKNTSKFYAKICQAHMLVHSESLTERCNTRPCTHC